MILKRFYTLRTFCYSINPDNKKAQAVRCHLCDDTNQMLYQFTTTYRSRLHVLVWITASIILLQPDSNAFCSKMALVVYRIMKQHYLVCIIISFFFQENAGELRFFVLRRWMKMFLQQRRATCTHAKTKNTCIIISITWKYHENRA